jgi:hypothetical protein
MAARLSALRAGRTLPPGLFIFKDSWYSFLLEAESTPGPYVLDNYVSCEVLTAVTTQGNIATYRSIDRQRLSKHVYANTTIGAVFSLGPCYDRC